ncbi:MAG: UDP-3-O-[3-hydroxymyristoyl] N-acetylglucosamine deacetylase, partial [Bacteroidales bacterium]|nr:UDP-3-O-[3-hydroxymyristoyl] N-acetylglucosamine deacetylase [Bacteroidales bacterium]
MSQVKQRTLKNNFILNGIGLHTGKDIHVNFLPAPDNHGIKIKRIDLDEETVIPALAEYVTGTQRGTVLSRGNVHVSTVEHAMAALYAKGIDNCLIEVNAPEFPILDGSSSQYINAINEAGTEEQESYKDFYVVRRKMEVSDPKTGAKLTLLPDDNFSINSYIEFESQLIHNQSASIENMDNFDKEIAPARTFVFVRDIEQLLKAGLIQGGNLENAVVIYETEMPQKQLNELAEILGVPHHDAVLQVFQLIRLVAFAAFL